VIADIVHPNRPEQERCLTRILPSSPASEYKLLREFWFERFVRFQQGACAREPLVRPAGEQVVRMTS
jgi:hypothetical protein